MNEFKFNTIQDFDDHISNSIKGYNLLHDLIVNISSYFIKKDETVYDLGTTTGLLPIKLNNTYGCKVVGYDIIDDNFIKNKSSKVELKKADILEIKIQKSNLFFLVFTLQFLPIEKRLSLLKKIYESLNKSGALIICEKEYTENALTQEIFTFCNYQNKINYFTADEILNKEKQLRHSMQCLTKKENEMLFKKAGFKTPQVFFKSLNFTGYILIK